MRYFDFRDSIRQELIKHPQGLTWVQLRDRLHLPYRQPCQTWIARLESEIGLLRKKRIANALIWKIDIMNKPASKQ
jgi:hypothetical protein